MSDCIYYLINNITMKTNTKKTTSFPTGGTTINYAEMQPADLSAPERIIAKLIDEGKIDGKTAILLLKAVYKPAEIKIEPLPYPAYPNWPSTPIWTTEQIKAGTDAWTSTFSPLSQKCSDSTK